MGSFLFSIQYVWILVNYDRTAQQTAKWLANIFMYISAITLSISISASLLPITYLGFLIAHVIWSYFAWKINDKPLLAQFLFFIPIDLYAMYIRL